MAYEDRIMRMADSVPQRTVRPDIIRGFDRAGQVRETNEMPRYTNTPTSRVNPIAGMNLYPQQRGYEVDPGLRRGAYEQRRNQGLDRAVPAGEQGIFGGGNLGADNIVNAILGGMNRSQGGGFDETKIDPSDWRRIWQLQQKGIDPSSYIESAKWGPDPFPGPHGDPLSPGPFYPGGGRPDEWDIVERPTNFESDWKGQQKLMDNIKIQNPTLPMEELQRLFEEAMARATRIRT